MRHALRRICREPRSPRRIVRRRGTDRAGTRCASRRSEPALRFEVNVARARKLYPLDETPVPLAGFDCVPTRVTGGRGTLDAPNRSVLDVVYVPRQTWHYASFGGSEGLRSCRLAMNGFPYRAHMFEAD